MDEKKKLIGLILETLEKSDYKCELCIKMGYKCRVEIPDNAPSDFQPDFSKCDFQTSIYKTLTIDN